MFHYREEPADVAESCQLVWELPGDGGAIKSQGCGGGGGRKLVSVHMPILDGPSLTILSS